MDKEKKELKERVQRSEVQLAGCSVAALGWADKEKAGDYGWSASFQDVLKLRKKYEKLLKTIKEAK